MEIFQKISGLTPSQMVFVYSYLFKTAYNRIPPNRLKTGFMESYDLRKVSSKSLQLDHLCIILLKSITTVITVLTVSFRDSIFHGCDT